MAFKMELLVGLILLHWSLDLASGSPDITPQVMADIRYYTDSITGCTCDFDYSREDCACCKNGGEQCGDNTFPHHCVAPSGGTGGTGTPGGTGGTANMCLKLPPQCQLRRGDRCFQAFTSPKKSWNETVAYCRSKALTDIAVITEDDEDWLKEMNRTYGLTEAFWHSAHLGDGMMRWVDSWEATPYQGCFTTYSVVGPYVFDDPQMTPGKCKSWCNSEGMEIAAISMVSGQPGMVRCRCYGDLPTERVVEESCATPCPADSSDHCGGYNFMAVYNAHTDLQYANWAPVPERGEGHCVFHTSTGWKRGDCLSKRSYICMYDASSSDDCSSEYEDAMWLSGVCMSYHRDTETWYYAQHECTEHGGDLLNASNRTVYDIIKDTKNDYEFWIGLSDQLWEVGTYNWGNKEPSTNGQCAVSQPNNDFKWFTAPCEQDKMFLCQLDADDILEHIGLTSTDPPYYTTEDYDDGSANDESMYSTTTTSTTQDDMTSKKKRPPTPRDPYTTPRPAEPKSDSTFSAAIIGAAVGGAVGALFLVGCIVICCFCCRRKRSSSLPPQPVKTPLPPDGPKSGPKSSAVYQTSPDDRYHYVTPGHDPSSAYTNRGYDIYETISDDPDGIYQQLDPDGRPYSKEYMRMNYHLAASRANGHNPADPYYSQAGPYARPNPYSYADLQKYPGEPQNPYMNPETASMATTNPYIDVLPDDAPNQSAGSGSVNSSGYLQPSLDPRRLSDRNNSPLPPIPTSDRGSVRF